MKLLGFIVLLLSLTAFSNETWPRFRGAKGAGVSSAKLPTKLSKDTLFWSTKLPGPGSSSPVIWKDKLFVTSENRDKKTINLVCLHARSGKTLWSKPLSVGNYHLHRFNNTAAATPTVNSKAVLLSWFDGKAEVAMLTAFDHNGTKLWDFNIGAFKTQHGFNLHPVIYRDHVYIAPLHMEQGYVAGLHLSNGKLAWKKTYPGKKTSYITPYMHHNSWGSEVIIASQATGVVALDAITGKETWTLPDTMKQRTIVSPIELAPGNGIHKGLIGVGCKNGVYFAVRPPEKYRGAAEIAWHMKGKTPYVPTPVSNGSTVFALSDGGTLSALDAKSGKTKWTQELRANFYASPLLADRKLYALSREGELIIADIDAGYVEVSRNSLNPAPETTSTDATPAIAHHKIYLRVGARLDCHGIK